MFFLEVWHRQVSSTLHHMSLNVASNTGVTKSDCGENNTEAVVAASAAGANSSTHSDFSNVAHAHGIQQLQGLFSLC